MEPRFFIQGLVVGFSIAAPVGPIGVLCIRRSLTGGMALGLATGLGAATADAAYGGIAGFGLTAISGFLVKCQLWLALIGGIFLCYLGLGAFLSKPAPDTNAPSSQGLVSAYSSTVLLTLANPATILSFIAVFAGLGLGANASYPAAATLVFGVFTGSALWWLLLSGAISQLRSRVNSVWMRTINRLSGVTLFAFGLYALSRV
jgi:threonine/homoserine/homoserine lactone efflux protein